jgi:hypothetical protein
MTPVGSAIFKASQTSCAVMRSDMDQPSTRREYRSMTVARYNQPSSVHKYVISPTYFWLGAEAEKSCWSRLGATGRLCFEFVVALNFFAALARNLWRRILLAIVLRSYGCPASSRSSTNLVEPDRLLRALKACFTA